MLSCERKVTSYCLKSLRLPEAGCISTMFFMLETGLKKQTNSMMNVERSQKNKRGNEYDQKERDDDFCLLISQTQYQMWPTRNLLQRIVGHDHLQILSLWGLFIWMFPQLMSLSSITLTVGVYQSVFFYCRWFVVHAELPSVTRRSRSLIHHCNRPTGSGCVWMWWRTGMTEEPIREERDLFV